MDQKHVVKFYPVDNADNTLIKLIDGTTIQVDCQIREGEQNSSGIKIFDVKKDLLKDLEKDSNKNPFVDLFVLSHPHKDHCVGFEGNYYCGDPDNYTESNRDDDEIIIGELWVTQRVFSTDICEDAKPIRREAKRRRKLFNEDAKKANKYGNRLRIIGYNDEDNVTEGLHYIPGSVIKDFNGKTSDYLEIFIHAPFKSDLVTGLADKDHNATSIVFQAGFKVAKNGGIKSRAIFGGDADHYIWEKVLRKSEKHGNEDRLKWDIFLSPHHCSWSFFNDRPYEDNKEPKDYSLEFLDYKQTNGYIVASCVKIENNDNNPPHFYAREKYVKKTGANYFKNTAINKSEKEPKPLEFWIEDGGLKLKKSEMAASMGILGSSTPRAGI